ncbi:MAG TPA: hypothetical protein ENI65_03000 [Gammaproteobacteria bacterium]|nr:hypothetical protein [Gammaproteobacteria bacterium]
MNSRLSFLAFGHATSLLFLISFVLCVGFDFIFPEHAMYQSWQRLLPGFEWISWKSFLIGMVESYAYGWYVTLIWIPLYNVFSARSAKTEKG